MRASKWRCLLAGGLAGAANGFFGGGGGSVLVPLLTKVCGLDQRRAFATSVAVILPLCALSVILYFLRGRLDLMAALPYLLGGAAGGWIGGRWFKGIKVNWLKRAFGLLLIYGGLRCFSKGMAAAATGGDSHRRAVRLRCGGWDPAAGLSHRLRRGGAAPGPGDQPAVLSARRAVGLARPSEKRLYRKICPGPCYRGGTGLCRPCRLDGHRPGCVAAAKVLRRVFDRGGDNGGFEKGQAAR